MPLDLHRMLSTLALLALVLIPASGLRAADQAPYVVNAILGITGSAALQGQEEAKTLGVVETLVNRQGGIGGRPIKLVVNDDQNNPQIDVQLVARFAAEKVPFVIGPPLAGTCGAAMPIIAQNGGPVIYCLTPGVQPQPGSFAFTSGPNVDDAILVLVRYFRERGLTRLAALVSTDGSGQSYEHGLTYALSVPENKDVRLVAGEHMNPGDISAAAQVARIKAANPQALLTLATGAPWGTMMHSVGDAALSVPIGAGHGNTSATLLEQYKAFLPSEVFFPGVISLVPNTLARGAVLAAQTRYFAALKEAGIQWDLPTSLAWDPAWLLVDALRKLGTNATAPQIRDYLSSLHGWAGVMGTYDFQKTPQRGIAQDAIIIDRWDTAKAEFSPVGRPGGYLR
jgi:branched-chain amino acid transport system substrate-binding protein